MRVALFTETFLPRTDGIVTRLTRTLEQLEVLGHEALVFAPGVPPARYGAHRVVPVPSLAFPWYPEVRVGLPAARIGRALADFRPDLVHAVGPVWLAAYGVLAAGRRDLPLLASFHTDIPEYTRRLGCGLHLVSGTSERWIRWLHNRAEVTLCTSEPMVAQARAVGVERVGLWPKAVDTVRYAPAKRSSAMRERLTGGHPEQPLMLYVGRLSREKDLDALLEPVRSLPGVRLAFVGSGPYRAELERRFAGTPTVFTGYLSGDELAAAYASADVFAFPSTTETLGLVALESMASGVPVVGARAGGIPFAVTDGQDGFLVTPGDGAMLTDRLRRLLYDGRLRAAFGSRARAEALRHGWPAATEALVGFYELAVTRHGSR